MATATVTEAQSASAFPTFIQYWPQTYNGDRNPKKLLEFITQLEFHIYLNKLVADDDKLRLAACCLRGSAATWFNGFLKESTAAGRAFTFDAFIERLKAHFYPEEDQVRVLKRFYQIRQKTSVEKFNKEFYDLLYQVPAHCRDEARTLYVNALKPEIRLHVAPHYPETLKDAMDMALMAEENLYPIQNRSSWTGDSDSYKSWSFTNGQRHATPDVDPDAMGISAITSAKKLTPAEREKLQRAGICFFCRKEKHLARDCPYRRDFQ